jgi:hypothetical protein
VVVKELSSVRMFAKDLSPIRVVITRDLSPVRDLFSCRVVFHLSFFVLSQTKN